MALILPLHVLDGLRRSLRHCYSPSSRSASTSSSSSADLITCLIDRVPLVDAVRWRRVSRAFRAAVDRRLACITRLEVQSAVGLRHAWQLRTTHAATANDATRVTWHSSAAIAFLENSPQHLCIYVDSALINRESQVLVDAVSCFRHYAETVFMDSPILELLVAEMSKQQVDLLVLVLRQMRKLDFTACKSEANNMSVIPLASCSYDAASFFPRLRQLTIQSLVSIYRVQSLFIFQANQLSHLSRLHTYAVGVDRIYEPRSIDLLCLKITVASSRHARDSNLMFRHVTRFRHWADADALGVRYFQQFGGTAKRRRRSVTVSRA